MTNADFNWQRECLITHRFPGGYVAQFSDGSTRILVFSHYVSLAAPFRQHQQYIARWDYDHYEFDLVNCDSTFTRITPVPTKNKK